VLILARLVGGLAAGMAYPTTLSLITALWTGAGRTKSIALWSALGGAISALGPLVAGVLLTTFWWGSVFLVTLPLIVVSVVMVVMVVPAHVNESDDPVDHLGGILSAVLVGAFILAINFAAVPDAGTLVALGLAVLAVAALIAFVIQSAPLQAAALRPRRRRPADVLGRRLRRHHRVRRPDGGHVHWPAVPAERAGLQQRSKPAFAILPAAVCDGSDRTRSAKLVDTKGARFTLLVGLRVRHPGRLHHRCWRCCGGTGCRTGRSGSGMPWSVRVWASPGPRRRTRSPARFRSPRRAWPRAPPICSATSAGPSCSR
jgi:DHA2 family multidrug resistance protein-like MFS transporter